MINLKEIPSKTTFHINIESAMFDVVLEGDFKVHRPTIEEIHAISSEVSAANNGQPFSVPEYAALILARHELSHVIDSSPDWWEQVFDANDTRVIMRVFGEYSDWRRSPFRFESRRLEEAKAREL